jgi:hypothetical protein
MKYRERLRIERPNPGSGVQDPDTGTFAPAVGGATVVYDGPADVQHSGRAITRTEGGQPATQADAVVFLQQQGAAERVNVGDTAVVTMEDGETTHDCEVAKTNWLDDSLLVRFL